MILQSCEGAAGLKTGSGLVMAAAAEAVVAEVRSGERGGTPRGAALGPLVEASSWFTLRAQP